MTDESRQFGSPRSMLRQIGQWFTRHPNALDDLQFVAEQLSSSGQDGLTFAERFSRAVLPPNWWSLSMEERTAAMRLVQSSAICLVWVPRADVVRELLAADGKVQRDSALVANRSSILDDLDAVHSASTHPMLIQIADSAKEAVDVERAGFHRAAQALCASIVTAVLDEHYDTPRFADARVRLEEEIPGTARLRIWRRGSVQSVLLAAIAVTWSDPPPEGFNRHLTAHGVDPNQFTDAHVLEALLLVGGMLRELHEIYASGHGGAPPAGPNTERLSFSSRRDPSAPSGR